MTPTPGTAAPVRPHFAELAKQLDQGTLAKAVVDARMERQCRVLRREDGHPAGLRHGQGMGTRVGGGMQEAEKRDRGAGAG